MSDFGNEYVPANSHKSKEPEPVKEKVVEKVVTGNVVRKKQPMTKRFAGIFISEDPKVVAKKMTEDIIIPGAKDMILDVVTMSFEMFLHGEVRSRPRSTVFRTVNGSASPTHVSYNRYSRPSASTPPPRPDREAPRQRKPRTDIDQILFDTATEAKEVVDGLFNMIERYNQATIGDLYGLIGETGSHTDEKWGWTDISDYKIVRTQNKYLIVLRPAEPLD